MSGTVPPVLLDTLEPVAAWDDIKPSLMTLMEEFSSYGENT